MLRVYSAMAHDPYDLPYDLDAPDNYRHLAHNSRFGPIDDDPASVIFTSLSAAREAIAGHHRLFEVTNGNAKDMVVIFDCPVMQAAYDLGPPESKIT